MKKMWMHAMAHNLIMEGSDGFHMDLPFSRFTTLLPSIAAVLQYIEFCLKIFELLLASATPPESV